MSQPSGTRRFFRCAPIALTAAIVAIVSLAPRADTSLSFDGGVLVDATNREVAYELGDFNEDGYPDVVTSNANGTVSLLINRTDNWFYAAAGTPIAVGADNQNLVVGDFNGDTHFDAAIASRGANAVYVLLGNGAGTLTQTGSYPTGSGPFDLATADLNGDGTLDLVTANQANTVPVSAPSASVLLGSGDGTFTAASPRDYIVGSAGALARGVAIGDVTGEGDPDVVIALTNANYVRILTGAGDGTFTVGGLYATSAGPRKVVLADFDEDGDLDIATADSGDGVPANPANRNNKTTILINQGTGIFSPGSASPFPTGAAQSSPFAIRTADLDGDGHLDLVTANRYGNGLSVLRGNGDGTFAAPIDKPYPEFTSAEVTDVVVGDIDSDGKPDLIGNASGTPGFLVLFRNTTTIGPPTVSATTPALLGNVGNPSVSGTTGGATVTLYTTSDCSDSPAATGSRAQFQGAGITVSVPPDQTLTFYATTTNAAGWATSSCSPTSATYTYDATPPDAPADLATTPVSPSSDNSPEIAGSAEIGSTIRIYASGDCSGSPAAIGTAANFAGPGITVSVSADSTTTLTATATDPAGNASSCSTPISYIEDSTAPATPGITSSSPASPVNENSPELLGTAEAGSTVRIYATADCSGSPATTGSAASFSSPGLTVSVGDNSSTPFTATATDASGNTSACSPGFTYTEDSLADPPGVTGATTLANIQTTSGLVVTPAAADAAGVTHFRISNITGGTLFQTDGTTPIANGAYITVAQGASGLKFTPTTGSSTNGGFDAQAALGETLTGISTATPGTITVRKHATATLILSDDPDPSDQSQLTRVAYTVFAGDGSPTPTGTVQVTASGGSETCSGTLAAGSCDILLTTVGLNRTLTATYSGDVVSAVSADTTLHTVTACTASGVVTSTADSGAGSLRQAIAGACTNGSITFDIAGAGPHTIALESALAIDKNLTITGPSDEPVILYGAVASRLMVIGPAAAPTLSRLTFSLGLGPAVSNSGNLTILESTLNSNIATDAAPGALFNDGTVTIRNSTFSSNISQAGRGGAIANAAGGQITLLNVTATNNYAEVAGGAIYNTGTISVKNSIVAGNSSAGGTDWVDNGGIRNDLGHNLLSGEPWLAPLQFNGGPTFTHMPLPGSPAIDGGDNTAAAGLTTDQRGIGFARALDGPDGDSIATVDIGAVEADPVVEGIADQATDEDVPLAVPFNVGDAGTPFDSIAATSSNQTLVPDVNLAISGSGSTRTLTITSVANGHGTASITLTVTKTVGGTTLTASHVFLLTVNAVPDAPAVTDAATKVNAQTTSGLVITANPVDDEVRFFRISSITNGSLFQNDGVSPIGNNYVIDVAQGNAGLRFTPLSYITATGSFSVQSVTNGGVVGPAAIATITVDKYATTTTITSADPNPSDQTQEILVTFSVVNAEGGLVPTGFVTVTASGGTETCTAIVSNGVSEGECWLTLATAGVDRTLTATYEGDAASLASAGTALHTVNACEPTTVVTTNADGGPGSLRQALVDTCYAGTISFDMGSVVSPIGLTSGELVMAKSLNIEGPGANLLTIRRAGGTFRILSVRPGATAALGGLTLENGDATASIGGSGGGGAIYNEGASLELRAVELVGNTANWGGAIYNDGAVESATTLVLSSTLRGNTALRRGGAIFNQAGAGTGAVAVGLSTISGNQAIFDGGGLYNAGAGALMQLGGNTITNNRADRDSNGRGIGGGIWNHPASAPISMINTIVAGNFAGATDRDDMSGALNTTASFNLIGTGTNLTLINDGTNIVGSGSPVDPRLGPLANHGGGMLTHMPLAGSPALDAGTNDFACIPPICFDQRGPGFERIRTAAGGNASVPTADIGAVEADPTIAVIADQVTNEDTPLSFDFAVEDASIAFDSIVATSSDQTLVPDANLSVTGTGGTRSLTIAPAANLSGTVTITVTATKTIAGTAVTATEAFVLTVNSVLDVPLVTSATTTVNVQTTSGLVITANAADSDVAAFKITNITAGSLFQADGVTPIAENAVITVAEGNAGLRFTPATDSVAPGGFHVQSAFDLLGNGLSGAAVATVIVDKTPTITTIASHDPNPSDAAQAINVYFTVSGGAGPTPTGTVTVTASGGGETCSGPVATGLCSLVLTTAGVDRTLTATYGGDLLSLGSAGTALHTVNACTPVTVVTSNADSGPGSLRQALVDTCYGGSITFDMTSVVSPIALTSGELVVAKPVSIIGPGPDRLTITRTSGTFRLFHLLPGRLAIIALLRLANGDATTSPGGRGGAVYNDGGAVQLAGLDFVGNIATRGGAVASGDGVNPAATLVTFSSLRDNVAVHEGGAILNDEPTGFGGLGVDTSTISGNVAGAGGGGIAATGIGTLTEIRQSTITSNRADADEAGRGTGGGVWNDPASLPIAMLDTIVARNFAGAGTGFDDVSGTLDGIQSSYNLIGVNTNLTLTGGGPNIVGTTASPIDPRLGPLADNGGMTMTHMPLAGSPALDAATPGDASCDCVDQRGEGFARLRIAAGTGATVPTLDIGAVEADPTVAVIASKATNEDTPLAFTVAVGDPTIPFDSIVATSSDTTLVPDLNLSVTGTGTTRTLTMAPAADRSGSATITVTATKTIAGAALTATSSFLLTVNAINDAPTLNAIANPAPIAEDASQQTIDLAGVSAGGGEAQAPAVTAVSNNPALIPDPTVTYTSPDTTGSLRYTPVANASGTAVITVTVHDGGGTASGGIETIVRTFTVVVQAVADTPSITNASTVVNAQTTAGLVVSRNAADGSEVTHVQVSAISGGTLFQSDGTTPIANGAFITIAQGAAGLRFTPATNSTATGHVTIRASTSASAGGLGGAAVTADIAVNVLPSTTTVVTSGSPSNVGALVTFTATVTPAAPAATGTVQFMDGATPLGAPVALASGAAAFSTAALTAGAHPISAVYSGGPLHQASTGALAGGQMVGCPAMTIGPSTIPGARPGTAYSVTFTQTGGAGAIAFTLSGTLPPGLSFDAATATLSGTPTAPGRYPILVTATPANGCGAATASYTLRVGGDRTVLTGADAGASPHARRFTALDGTTPPSDALSSFFAFESSFGGGVRVAEGDVNGDGVPDYIAGAGPGRSPDVRVYDGATGALAHTIVAFEPDFLGGVFVAAGDVNGDGYVDIVAGSGEGRSGEVKVFSGRDRSVLADVFVFARAFTGGVHVAAGDVNGDGRADLVAGTGAGDATVTVLNGADLSALRTFVAYPGFSGGVWVAAGDVTGDGYADVVTGAGAAGGPHVRVFDGRTGAETHGFFAFEPAFAGGVRVAAGDVTGDGHAEIIAAGGPGGAPEVHVFDLVTSTRLNTVAAYAPGFTGGVFVATAVPVSRMAIDTPLTGATVRSSFTLSGWAFEESLSDAGIAGIDVVALPAGGGVAVPLGAATIGGARPDVAAIYGAQYANAGFHLPVSGLAPGVYDVRVTARSAVTGAANLVRTVRVTVAPDPQPILAIDIPAAGRLSSGDFAVAGWALTPETLPAPGVDAIHVWAAPVAGGAWQFLGAATLGVPRPDVAIVFGSQFASAGYYLNVTGLAAGTWDLVVFPRRTGTAAFAAAQTVRVTVPGGSTRSILTGADAGGGPHVRRFGALDGGPPAVGPLSSFFAFDPSFTGGVRVAEGDVTGDGVPDYIAGAGPGGAPEIRVIDGASGTIRASIVAFEPEFRGGVFVAAGDVNGDGFADVIAGSGEGRRGQVKVFSGRDGTLIRDGLVFDAAFRGGVHVAVGDVNGDGYADLVAGAGAGGSEVVVLSATDLSVLWTVTPYPGFFGGAWVAAGDVTGDGFADVITGAGPGGSPHVRVFDGRSGVEATNFFAYEGEFSGGVRVAVGDVTGDGRADVITGPGPGRAPEARVFDAATGTLLSNVLAYTPSFTHGVFVATAAPVNRMAIDTPANGAIVHGPFTLAGWAFDEHASNAGLDAIHVWAFPVAGGSPTFGGVATLGVPRPDVAALYGAQYAHAGFQVAIAGLAPGVYDIVVFGHSSVSGTFNVQRAVRVTVSP